ncbi:hypothetical protein M434DRAFT_15045 [Hypoxylon sp. CO27-5]|nr:hypothetical protein M434DRAFT_15045 [Hypoxylon sp. CO27-5]
MTLNPTTQCPIAPLLIISIDLIHPTPRYLRSCIDEAIRLAPPSLAPSWRTHSYEEQSEEPIIVDGYVVPRATEVVVSLYSLLHNEEYFPDSFDFKPERWIEPDMPGSYDGQAARALMHRAFAPFALGARGCPGKPNKLLHPLTTYGTCNFLLSTLKLSSLLVQGLHTNDAYTA